MKTISKYIKPYTGVILLTLFIKFLGALVELFIPELLATVIDDIIPKNDVTQILIYGGLMLLCAASALYFNITANRMSAKSSGKITRKIRYDLFNKILHLSARQTDEFTVPSMVSRISTDTYNVNEMIGRLQRIGIRGPILLIGGIIITSTIDLTLSLIIIASLPIISLIVYLVTRTTVPIYAKQQKRLDRLVEVLQENINGIRVIKALSKSDYESSRYDTANADLVNEEKRAGNIMSLSNPLTTLMLNISLVAVVFFGAIRVNQGLSTVGTIIAFINYFTMIKNAMMGVTRIFIFSSRGIASANRIEEILVCEDDIVLEEHDAKSDSYIEFRDVSFSYEGVENNLYNISFSLNRGETLGIIGSTGSGKSTIINLLLRLYDVNSGQITIDGKDIRSIPNEELRAKFGLVLQNDFLMANSIRNNISFYRDISDEDILKASKTAMAYDYISKRENTFDDELSVKANNISGGQKQRLLISRALASNPDILILDDASSALDYRTDADFRKALSENYSDTTSIVIAQRVSSIKNAEKILVLEEGHAIGYGTHDELLESCPTYKMIYDTQMGAVRKEVK